MRSNPSLNGLAVLVDGGGTKTRAVLVSKDEKRLGEGLAGPSNLMIGPQIARKAVQEACDLAISQAGLSINSAPALYCAMAGGSNSRLKDEFCAIAPEPALLVTDAYASMIGALGGKPGVGIVVGTGSAGYSLDRTGQIRECGGWGLAIGDDGSGAWVGRYALALAAKIVDGQRDPLLEGISASDCQDFARERLASTGMTRTELFEWVRVASPADFASLTPAIVAQGDAGNQVSIRLLQRASSCLEDIWLALDPEGDLPVCLFGGLAAHLEKYLPNRLRSAIQPAVGDVIDGLLALARGTVSPIDRAQVRLI